MRARTRESVLPLQSSSSLILASISREGDAPLVVALLLMLLAPRLLFNSATAAITDRRRQSRPASVAADFSRSAPGPARGGAPPRSRTSVGSMEAWPHAFSKMSAKIEDD